MKDIKQLRRLAWLLDNSIRVPGTSIKLGLDSLIGLVPGIGDIIGGGLSSYILLQAITTGVAPVAISRMAVNIVLDTFIGMIPLIGDIFDITFKANLRNIDLMNNYYNSPQEAVKRSTRSILISSFLLICAVVLIIWLSVKIFVSLMHAFN